MKERTPYLHVDRNMGEGSGKRRKDYESWQSKQVYGTGLHGREIGNLNPFLN